MISYRLVVVWQIYGANTTEIITEYLGDTLITQGKYEFKFSINVTHNDNELNNLLTIMKNWYVTCRKLAQFVPKLQCIQIYGQFESTRGNLADTQQYIKSFFGKIRSKRSWAFWNDMDSEDRVRIDKDLDTVRHNEEELKNTLNYHMSALDEMYKLVNESVSSVDEETLSLARKFELLKEEVGKDSKFVNNIKQQMYLQTGLFELKFWIGELMSSIKSKQDNILSVLLKQDSKQVILQTLGPNFIEKYLDETIIKLPENLRIPRRFDGQVDADIIKLIEWEFSLGQNFQIMLFFKVPLVKREPLTTRRITVMPYYRNKILSTIKLRENLILNVKDSEWGYTMQAEEFNRCEKLGEVRLCNILKIKENLVNSAHCVTNIIYNNNTNNCSIQQFKPNHDIWFATRDQNIWRYVAPHKVSVKILSGGNITSMNVIGTGEFRIQPNMSIETDSVKLSYFNEFLEETQFAAETMNINLTEIEIEDWKLNLIPVLNPTNKIYSFINRKELFDLGVDINQIKNHSTLLENLKYAPYKYPWWFSSFTVIAGLGLIGLLACCFKGNIRCCERKYVMDGDTNSERKYRPQATEKGQKYTREEKKETKHRDSIVEIGGVLQQGHDFPDRFGNRDNFELHMTEGKIQGQTTQEIRNIQSEINSTSDSKREHVELRVINEKRQETLSPRKEVTKTTTLTKNSDLKHNTSNIIIV